MGFYLEGFITRAKGRVCVGPMSLIIFSKCLLMIINEGVPTFYFFSIFTILF